MTGPTLLWWIATLAALVASGVGLFTLRGLMRRVAELERPSRSNQRDAVDGRSEEAASVAKEPSRRGDAAEGRPVSDETRVRDDAASVASLPSTLKPPAAHASAREPVPQAEPMSLPEPATPLAQVDRDEVLRLLTRWCRDGRFPDVAVERRNVRVTVASATDSSAPLRQFEDARQVAEFARIAPPGGDEAWLVPNPDAHFTPFVPRLFPALREGWERQPALYERVAPRRLLRRGAVWELSE